MEVTAPGKKGVFAAGAFGSAFMHASEVSRRIVGLARGDEPTFAILPPEDQAIDGALRPPAKVLSCEAMLGAMLPVGRTIYAEVTATDNGQVYLSMRDVDQSTATRYAPLAVHAPCAGDSVQCVVAHVNEADGPSWAICKLVEYLDDEGTHMEAYIARRDQHLGGVVLQPGDVLYAEVLSTPDDQSGPRVALRAGVNRRAGALARKRARKAEKALRQQRGQQRRQRQQQQQLRNNAASGGKKKRSVDNTLAALCSGKGKLGSRSAIRKASRRRRESIVGSAMEE